MIYARRLLSISPSSLGSFIFEGWASHVVFFFFFLIYALWACRRHHLWVCSANVLRSGSVILTVLSGWDGNLGDPDSLSS